MLMGDDSFGGVPLRLSIGSCRHLSDGRLTPPSFSQASLLFVWAQPPQDMPKFGVPGLKLLH